MAHLIAVRGGPVTALADFIEQLDGVRIDPRDPVALAGLAPMLARVSRRSDQFAELARSERDRRAAGGKPTSGYGAYSILLHRTVPESVTGDRVFPYVLRARFWPTRYDPLGLSSAAAPAFYDCAYSQPWPVLESGVDGPGCESEVYSVTDDGDVTADGGYRLAAGMVRVRAAGVIECRRPPVRRSVSIELLACTPVRDPRRYDPASGRDAGPLHPTRAARFRALALDFGGGDADGFLRHLASGSDDRIRNGS